MPFLFIKNTRVLAQNTLQKYYKFLIYANFFTFLCFFCPNSCIFQKKVVLLWRKWLCRMPTWRPLSISLRRADSYLAVLERFLRPRVRLPASCASLFILSPQGHKRAALPARSQCGCSPCGEQDCIMKLYSGKKLHIFVIIFAGLSIFSYLCTRLKKSALSAISASRKSTVWRYSYSTSAYFLYDI